MIESVNAYLDRASRKPWIYGGGEGGFRGHDCTLWAANWAHALTGIDPADDLRGTYSTREDAEAIVKGAGGFVRLMWRRLADPGRGWNTTEKARDGVIGVVVLPAIRFEGPAIRYGGRWLVADPSGIVALPGRTQAIWMWAPA